MSYDFSKFRKTESPVFLVLQLVMYDVIMSAFRFADSWSGAIRLIICHKI